MSSSNTSPRVLPALILIAVGLLFLASNLGLIKGSIGSLFTTWWPLIPLAIGIGMLLGQSSGASPALHAISRRKRRGM